MVVWEVKSGSLLMGSEEWEPANFIISIVNISMAFGFASPLFCSLQSHYYYYY